MDNNKEQQDQELEALESIFPQEFKCLDLVDFI
jgi:hypothetical protein